MLSSFLLTCLCILGENLHVPDLEIEVNLSPDRQEIYNVDFKHWTLNKDGILEVNNLFAEDIIVNGNPVILKRNAYLYYYDGGEYLNVTWNRKRIYYSWRDDKLNTRVIILGYDSAKDTK